MQKVLVTGVTGFVGTEVTLALVRKGYEIRGTTRTEDKAKKWEELHPETKGHIEWVYIPDVAVPGVFDEAVVDVDAIEHVASPFHFNVTDNERDLLRPAIEGTLSVLRSAKAHGSSVKHVTITSSFAAVFNMKMGAWPGKVYTEDDWNPVDYEEAKNSADSVFVYCASKKLAEEAAWNFLKDEKPSFTMTTLCPPMIFGPPEQYVESSDLLNQSAKAVWEVIDADEVPPTAFPAYVDVRDVAAAHVRSLETPHAQNKRYLLAGGNYFAEEIIDIIRRNFPEFSHRLPPAPPKESFEKIKPKVFGVDNSRAKKELEMDFIPLDDCIKDTARKLFELEGTWKPADGR